MKALLPLLLLAAAPAFAHPDAPDAPAEPAKCPQVAEQLAELLASAKQRIGYDGEVRVVFDVDAQGRARPAGLTGSRNYQTPVRLAMASLECQPGTPHRYVLNIRFADPMNLLAATPESAASATVVQASDNR